MQYQGVFKIGYTVIIVILFLLPKANCFAQRVDIEFDVQFTDSVVDINQGIEGELTIINTGTKVLKLPKNIDLVFNLYNDSLEKVKPYDNLIWEYMFLIKCKRRIKIKPAEKRTLYFVENRITTMKVIKGSKYFIEYWLIIEKLGIKEKANNLIKFEILR